MKKLKWTIKGKKEVVYTGTLKRMELYTGEAVLENKHGLYARGRLKTGRWTCYGKEKIMAEIDYDSEGLEDGEVRHYYETGKLESLYRHDDHGKSINYINYSREGLKRLYQEFDQDKRNLLKREIWYKNDGYLWQISRLVRGSCVYKKNIN